MSALFGSPSPPPPPPPPPEPKPPAPMPDPDSPAVREARRRAQIDILSRAGRTSTILTNPSNRGSDYSSTRLGSDR